MTIFNLNQYDDRLAMLLTKYEKQHGTIIIKKNDINKFINEFEVILLNIEKEIMKGIPG